MIEPTQIERLQRQAQLDQVIAALRPIELSIIASWMLCRERACSQFAHVKIAEMLKGK